MKRQSKAEEALHRQVKEIKHRIEDETATLVSQQIKINTLNEVRHELEDEISRLYKARVDASKRVIP